MGSKTKEVAIRLRLQDGDKALRGMEEFGVKGQRALKAITLGTTPASRGLKAVNAVTSDLRANMLSTGANLGAVGSGLMALGPGGVAAAAGIGALALSIKALLGRTRSAVAALAEIKAEAKRAGTGVEEFQALRYAAEDFQVSQDALTDGFKEMNLRADEFVKTGKGSAAEAFERLGFSQDELNQKLGDSSALFLEIVRRMQDLESEAARIRVADEIFGGTGGEQFVQMIGSGSDAIRQLMQDARELGYVLDSTIIERADESRRRLAQLERLVDLQLNQALVDLAPVLISLAETFADVASAVASVVDSFRDLEDMSSGGMRNELAGLNKDLEKLYGQHESVKSAMSVPGANKDLLQFELKGIQADIDAKMSEIMHVKALLDQREAARNLAPKGGTGKVGGETSDPFGDYMGRLNKRISAQQTEINVINQSAGAKARARAQLELNNIVAEEGLTLTKEQTHALQVSLDHLESATDKFQVMTDAQRDAAQMSREFGSAYARTMEDIVFESKRGADAVRELLLEMLKIQMRKQVFEPAGDAFGGFVGDIVGNIFGGGTSTAGGGMSSGIVQPDGYDPYLILKGGTPQPIMYDGGGYTGDGPRSGGVDGKGGFWAVMHPKETVIDHTKGGMSFAMPAQNVVVKPTVYVNAPGVSARTNVSQGANGELRLDTIVEQVTAHQSRELSRGEGLAHAIEGRYGVRAGPNSY